MISARITLKFCDPIVDIQIFDSFPFGGAAHSLLSARTSSEPKQGHQLLQSSTRERERESSTINE